MDEPELARSQEFLGVSPGCSLEDLDRAFAVKDAASNQRRDTGERERLRRAYNGVAAHLRAKATKGGALGDDSAGRTGPVGQVSAEILPGVPVAGASGREPEEFPLFAFDNWRVNVLVPPILLGLVWLVNLSPLSFFLKGFHVWMHEFGHATAAWMCGRRATPLPFGWTPVEPEFSFFVYFGLLLMFGVLFAAGWKERKVWPMMAAVTLAAVQFYMSWRMTERQQEFWWGAFGGVGGEFYLSALVMAFFFVELPEKFRWGMCRYVFFLIGATAFLNIAMFWNRVFQGLEDIPFGTMINGEDDQGGDMNKLMDLYGWSQTNIRNNYHNLGRWCWYGLAAVYAVFALRMNLVSEKIFSRFSAEKQLEQEN